MHTIDESRDRTLNLLNFSVGANCFNLFTMATDQHGFRVTLLEIVNGPRAGALAGFLWSRCAECGTDISADLLWFGLFRK